MIIEMDAVSAYPPEILASTYATWLQIERLPTSLTAPAVMLWGHDSNYAYTMWRIQHSESIYATQRIIAGWFAGTPANYGERWRRNSKYGKRSNRVRGTARRIV